MEREGQATLIIIIIWRSTKERKKGKEGGKKRREGERWVSSSPTRTERNRTLVFGFRLVRVRVEGSGAKSTLGSVFLQRDTVSRSYAGGKSALLCRLFL